MPPKNSDSERVATGVPCPLPHPSRSLWSPLTGDSMTLEEASHLAHKKANEFRLPMIVVKDDLSEETEGRNVGDRGAV